MDKVEEPRPDCKAAEARGWLRVLELAERQRRLREDGRVLRLEDGDRRVA